MRREQLQHWANACGFDLVGVASADPLPDAEVYQAWVAHGMAGQMHYLSDHRAALRNDVRSLLPSARSVICTGVLYKGPEPSGTDRPPAELGWIARYAWGEDYHDVLRRNLTRLRDRLREQLGFNFESRICVDTAPLLERAYARRAGLGWIGKNTCLINQGVGSWLFLGELITSLALEPDLPPPDRCGTCTRCLDACPTGALLPVPTPFGDLHMLDARRCISYHTIELRGAIPEQDRPGIGHHVFGCDICQEVCPWNQRAPLASEPAFLSPQRNFLPLGNPPLEQLAALEEPEFRRLFRHTPVSRAKYQGFLRNVVVAIGNSGEPRLAQALRNVWERHDDPVLREHTAWALQRLG